MSLYVIEFCLVKSMHNKTKRATVFRKAFCFSWAGFSYCRTGVVDLDFKRRIKIFFNS